jgi:hypothetical protein
MVEKLLIEVQDRLGLSFPRERITRTHKDRIRFTLTPDRIHQGGQRTRPSLPGAKAAAIELPLLLRKYKVALLIRRLNSESVLK